jgi:ferrous iron transport protein A
MIISIDQLRAGGKGVIRSVASGRGAVQKMEAIGLRPGKVVTKVSSQLMRGPVMVMIDGRIVAIGRGLASRVYVEPQGT